MRVKTISSIPQIVAIEPALREDEILVVPLWVDSEFLIR
jgi:hypothetical protein